MSELFFLSKDEARAHNTIRPLDFFCKLVKVSVLDLAICMRDIYNSTRITLPSICSLFSNEKDRVAPTLVVLVCFP